MLFLVEYIFWVPFLSSRIEAFKYYLSLLLWIVQLTVQFNNPNLKQRKRVIEINLEINKLNWSCCYSATVKIHFKPSLASQEILMGRHQWVCIPRSVQTRTSNENRLKTIRTTLEKQSQYVLNVSFVSSKLISDRKFSFLRTFYFFSKKHVKHEKGFVFKILTKASTSV